MNNLTTFVSTLVISIFLVGCSSSGGGSGSGSSIPSSESSGGSSSSSSASETDSSASSGETGGGDASAGGSGDIAPGGPGIEPGNGSGSGNGSVVEVLPSPNANFNSFAEADQAGIGDGIILSGVDREFTFTITESGKLVLSDDSDVRAGGTISLLPRVEDGEPQLMIKTAKGTVVDFAADPSDGFTTRPIENVGFNVPSPETFVLDFTPDLASTMVGSDPFAIGWDYQTFGVWVNETSPTSGSVGVISAGRFTPASNIPTTGTGEFTGYSAGLFTDGSATFLTAAEVSASVSFQNRTVNFRTINTHMAPEGDTVSALINRKPDGYTFSPNPALNLNGSLRYADGSNQFSGEVTSAAGAGQMTGDAVGHFYGPGAQEIGGSFTVRGNEGQAYIGGFGAQRPNAP